MLSFSVKGSICVLPALQIRSVFVLPSGGRQVMEVLRKRSKIRIHYARTYRHFAPESKKQWGFLLGVVLPCMLIFLFFFTELTFALSSWVRDSLDSFFPAGSLGIVYRPFLPIFGGVYFVQLPNQLPTGMETAINLMITLAVIFAILFAFRHKKGGTPVSIYVLIILILHLVSCIFFLFAKEYFPYTVSEYSELYMLQQVGLWLAFVFLAGVISGVFGYGKTGGRMLLFFGIITYSLVFGCVRYLVYLYILSCFSTLYMTTLFFSLGPMFDFIYLVFLYSVFINSRIEHFNYGEGMADWQWM